MLVLIVSILLARTLGLFPGTPIFFVVGYAVVAEIAVPAGEFGPRLLVAVAAASVAWLLTMSGWLLRRVAGRREPPPCSRACGPPRPCIRGPSPTRRSG